MNRYRAAGYYNENWTWVAENPNTSVQEHRQGKTSTHICIPGTAQDKAATCTTAGYTGRIFCVECDCGAKENVYNAKADAACTTHGACGSVINWGTVIPATGHNYSVVDGVLACGCGKTFTGVYTDGKTYVEGIVAADGWTADNTMYFVDGVALTGVKLIDGAVCVFSDAGIYDADASAKYLGFVEDGDDLYYAQLGQLVSGWQSDENGDFYYFQPDTYKAFEDGFLTVDGRTYEFADKIQIDGHWAVHSNGGIYLTWAGVRVANGWKTIKGNTYYFRYGYAYTGVKEVHLTYNSIETDWHLFDENGVWQRKLDGIYGDYYYMDGQKAPSYYGLVEFEGDYYYVNNNNRIVRDAKKYLNKTHGLTFPDGTPIPNAEFYFNADGKMQYTLAEPEQPDTPVVPPVEPEEPEVLNGLVGDYFYIDGVRAKAYYGLVEWNGNFYYVNDGGRIVRDMKKYLTKTHDLTFEDGTPIPNAEFYFNAEGKMQYTLAEPEQPDTPVVPPVTPEEPEVLNGIVGNYYYIDGVRAKAYYGLVEWEGNFYYVNDGGRIVRDAKKYVNKPNGLKFSDGTDVPKAEFYFNADGVMQYTLAEPEEPDTPVVPEEPEVLNGIVGNYYYIDGVRAKAYYGLVEWEGNFYYVNDGGRIVRDAKKYVNKPNGLKFSDGTDVPKAEFYFNADGKMIID